MARRQVGLLAQIEKGALDESIPLTSTLRKCVVLVIGSDATRSEMAKDLDQQVGGSPVVGRLEDAGRGVRAALEPTLRHHLGGLAVSAG